MSFFADMLGKTSAKAASTLGNRSMDRTNAGFGIADTASKTGFDQAMGIYRPWAEGGQRAQTAYENTLGLNGDDARRQQFQTGYLNDPALAYRNQNNTNQMNALFRRYNAGPQGINSGAAMLGAGRLATEQFNNDWGNYQSRLMGAGQQGYGAARDMARVTQGYYGDVADRAIGRAGALNTTDAQATQAMNNARMAGVNNLFKLAGGAAQLAMGMPPTSRGGGGGGGQGGGQGGGNGNSGSWWNNLWGGGGRRSDDGAGVPGDTYYSWAG